MQQKSVEISHQYYKYKQNHSLPLLVPKSQTDYDWSTEEYTPHQTDLGTPRS